MEQPDGQDTTQGVDLQEVLAEMDDRTRVGWELAVSKVENRRLREALAAARNEQNPTGVPPAGESS